jgi:hypothetical protein
METVEEKFREAAAFGCTSRGEEDGLETHKGCQEAAVETQWTVTSRTDSPSSLKVMEASTHYCNMILKQANQRRAKEEMAESPDLVSSSCMSRRRVKQ